MKRLTTNDKIKFLQAYVKKWHKRWHRKHAKNIIGFKIGKKRTNGVESRDYSIIFQVKKKRIPNRIHSENLIPAFFRIKFPDGVTRQIKTDVEEVGVLTLQAGITSEVNSVYSNNFGSVGLFVTDSANRVFMLTNYHVVAERMIRNGMYYYRRPNAQIQNDVRISSAPTQVFGRLEEGIISREVDAAFVEIFTPPDGSMNVLPDQNKVRSRLVVRPYPPSFRGKPVVVYSFFNRYGRSAIISDNSSVLYTSNPEIYFDDLLEISPKITQGGDSGGAVVTPSFSILGLVVGARDDAYGGKTYVIPFYKINDFKNVFII